ncbi:HlyC/CorC family transporter [Martelella lutilitoris]|uniref:HlyC/CorC family transporter n=1 Tax=Martelella lutilitoris TaxID=2583532 RepID=A0A5C4JLQ6_9HYPH|nr:hemolysin family protein [Martelella lutilitoris]TNB46121.1 HlyC/CorC family transporter [Martelella lutilitoris]
MNQQQIVPLAESGQDTEDGSSLDEPNSPVSDRNSNKHTGSPLRGLLLRFRRNGNAASRLREDLEDALSTDNSGDSDFSPEERAMLNNILSFREVRVEDVMVPRADIDAVEQSTTIGDLLLIFENCGHSRMPVFCETLDDPRGMVHIRDLLAYLSKQARGRRRARTANARDAAKASATKGGEVKPAERPSRTPQSPLDLGKVNLDKTVAEAGIIRPVLFVPPSMLASDLLQRMQAGRTQMALVIDEYGGTDGLVSHEDIVEMVIGEIDDEHDSEEAMFTRVSEDVFLADARVELEDIAEAIGPDFEIGEHAEDVDTLGGLIFSAIGRIPARGEVIQALPGFEVHILDADPRRIRRVRILRKRGPARRRSAAQARTGVPAFEESRGAGQGEEALSGLAEEHAETADRH